MHAMMDGNTILGDSAANLVETLLTKVLDDIGAPSDVPAYRPAKTNPGREPVPERPAHFTF